MSGVVHFKFRSAISFDSVVFDGHFITVAELKRLIAEKKGLGREAAPELVLADPRTNNEYSDDSYQVPKNSSVLVRRVPGVRHRVLQSNVDVTIAASVVAANSEPDPAQEDEFGADLYSDQAAAQAQYEEESKAINSIVDSSAKDWQSVRGGRGGGRGRGGRGRGFGPGELRPGYICYRCGRPGHRINECPTKDDPTFEVKQRVRHSAGIPMSKLARSEEGGLLLPDGNLGTLLPNKSVLDKEIAAMPTLERPSTSQRATPEPTTSTKDEPPSTTPQGAQADGVLQEQPGASAGGDPLLRMPSAALFDEEDDVVPSGGKAVELGLGMDAPLSRPEQQEARMPLGAAPQAAVRTADAAVELRKAPSEEITAELLVQLRDVLPQGPMKAIVQAFLGDQPLSPPDFEDLQRRCRSEQAAVLDSRRAELQPFAFPSPTRQQYNRFQDPRLDRGARHASPEERGRALRRHSPAPAEYTDMREFLTSKARNEQPEWLQRRHTRSPPGPRFENEREFGRSRQSGDYMRSSDFMDSRPAERSGRRFETAELFVEDAGYRCFHLAGLAVH